jgi:hypothetical protein
VGCIQDGAQKHENDKLEADSQNDVQLFDLTARNKYVTKYGTSQDRRFNPMKKPMLQ